MSAGTFRYTARTVDGEIVRGSMEAADADNVLTALRTRALFVTAIDRESQIARRLGRSIAIGGASRKSLLAFFRSFATLIRAGVSMQRGLTVSIERCEDPTLREALRSVLSDVEHGTSLSEAMSRRRRAFPILYVAMIRAGEEGGILDDVLERLATFLERDSNLRKKVQAALAYPLVVLSAAFTLVVFLIARIVPMFAGMFDSFHVELPVTTRILLGLGQGLQSPLVWAGLPLCVLFAAIALDRYNRTAAGAFAIDRLRLRIPVIGTLVQKSIVARVARMLATLLRSGIELVSAIDVVIPVAGSAVYGRALTRINIALREGDSLTRPLAESRVFDPLVVALVRVGEETGLVDDMLLKIAEYFEGDVETTVATIGAIIEPTLIIFLGTAVGFIVFSIFIPLYSLIGSVSK
jgi:type IV pilus assembly protein PilC